jgi:4,5-DOPA dioxygenase extradiol
MYPDASVPVVQLSLVRHGAPAAHLALGRALAPLREEGVLILASGAITHNFDWLDWRGRAAPLPQAHAFSEWVGARLAAHDVPALLDYRATQYGAAAHPTEEHFLPLFVALGAADGDAPARHQPDFSYGGLAMDAYVWRRQQ